MVVEFHKQIRSLKLKFQYLQMYTKAKPIDEQLAQVLDINPIDVPENKDLLSFNFEFLIM